MKGCNRALVRSKAWNTRPMTMIIATAGTTMTSAIHQAPRNSMKTARLLDCQIAREDASGQPRKRDIKQDDQR